MSGRCSDGLLMRTSCRDGYQEDDRMTPLFIGLANEDGVVMVKRLPPKPEVHWVWKLLYYGLPVGVWLAMVIGVVWIG